MNSNKNQMLFEDNSYSGNDQRKKIHIPFCDVDDLAFKNRHDPNFIASITNLMQVPSTITVNNGNMPNRNNYNYFENPSFPMDIPEKLTADEYSVRNRGADSLNDNDSLYDELKDSEANITATPPSTPTKLEYLENNLDEEKFGKTPQIAADLFKRMKPRRSSIEVDLHAEIRILRDKINYLEHECQINSRSTKVFYAVLCGYALLKTFSWLVNAK